MTGLLIAPCNAQLKWRKAQQDENKKSFRQSPSCAETPDTNLFFRRCPETRHAWCTLSFDFHPELSIKIIQRLHFITWARGNLSAIKSPLVSVEKFSRWTSGLEEAEHEMKCTWLPALPFVQTWLGTLEQMCRHRLQQTGQGCAWNREPAVMVCLSDWWENHSIGYLRFRMLKISHLLFFAIIISLVSVTCGHYVANWCDYLDTKATHLQEQHLIFFLPSTTTYNRCCFSWRLLLLKA